MNEDDEVLLTKEQVTGVLIADVYKVIEEKYGKNSERHLPYHGVEHAKDLVTTAEELYKEISKTQVIPTELSVVKIAAAFHDVEQDMGSGKNEQRSADIAVEKMHESGLFTDAEKEAVKKMIMATVAEVGSEGIIQSPSDDIESQIIADADLSSLGREPEVYWGRACKLLDELRSAGVPITDGQFISLQLIILSRHEYFTEAGREILGPGVKENLRQVTEGLLTLPEPSAD